MLIEWSFESGRAASQSIHHPNDYRLPEFPADRLSSVFERQNALRCFLRAAIVENES